MKRLFVFLLILAVLGGGGFFFIQSWQSGLRAATSEDSSKSEDDGGQPDAVSATASSAASSTDRGEDDPPEFKMAAAPLPQAFPKTYENDGSVKEAYNSANAVVAAPDKMTVGEAQRVTVEYSLHKSIDELNADLGDQLPTTGTTIDDATPFMEMTLTGDTFEIQPLSEKRQAIHLVKNTQWSWSVTPKESGEHSLTLTISAVVNRFGVVGPQVVERRKIDLPRVEVSLPNMVKAFLIANFQWVWVVFVVPLAGFLSRIFTRRG